MKKRFISMLIAVAMIITAMPITVRPAKAAIFSYFEGTEISFAISNYSLRIYGEGAMPEFVEFTNGEHIHAPWYTIRTTLNAVEVWDNVTSISDRAFWGLSNLKSVKISDSVTRIGEEAFAHAANLDMIIISENVVSIADNVFIGCEKLKIHCRENSTAHTYAVNNNIPFVLIGNNNLPLVTTPPKIAPPIENTPEIKPGHVLGNSTIGIGDALEILKFLAGLPNEITSNGRDSRQWKSACITGGDKPVIGDALEILKYLANIDNAIDNSKKSGNPNVSINAVSNRLVAGWQYQLNVDWNGSGQIKYKSYDESIATVNESGAVTALKAGTVVISVYVDTGKLGYPAKNITLSVANGDEQEYSYEIYLLNPYKVYASSPNANAIIYIKTDNPDPRMFAIIGGGHRITANFHNVKYTGNNDGAIKSVDGGYIVFVQPTFVGEHTVTIWEMYKNANHYEFGIGSPYFDRTLYAHETKTTVTFYAYYKNIEYNKWVEDIIAKSTNNSMSFHEKMASVSQYILNNTLYPPNSSGYESPAKLLNLITQYGEPWDVGILDSISSPSLLIDIAERLGCTDYIWNPTDQLYHAYVDFIYDGVKRTYMACHPTSSNAFDPNNLQFFDFSRLSNTTVTTPPTTTTAPSTTTTTTPETTTIQQTTTQPPQQQPVNIGEIIQLGDSDWRVLDIQDGKALILSENIITSRQYHSNRNIDVTWENSDIREWLNGTFYNDTFTAGEKARINEVILLNVDEIEKYQVSLSSAWWWTRSQGSSSNRATLVRANGSIDSAGNHVDNNNGGIRPALWLDL